MHLTLIIDSEEIAQDSYYLGFHLCEFLSKNCCNDEGFSEIETAARVFVHCECLLFPNGGLIIGLLKEHWGYRKCLVVKDSVDRSLAIYSL